MALQFLLDTNTCIYIMNRRPPQVAERFAQYPPDAIGLSGITLGELSYGVEKSRSSRNRLVLEGFLAPPEVVPGPPGAMERSGAGWNGRGRLSAPWTR